MTLAGTKPLQDSGGTITIANPAATDPSSLTDTEKAESECDPYLYLKSYENEVEDHICKYILIQRSDLHVLCGKDFPGLTVGACSAHFVTWYLPDRYVVYKIQYSSFHIYSDNQDVP